MKPLTLVCLTLQISPISLEIHPTTISTVRRWLKTFRSHTYKNALRDQVTHWMRHLQEDIGNVL